jgi:hypothetical protein
MNPSDQSPLAKPGAADFDFLFGTWRVHHRKLKHRLAGETDWIQFEDGIGTFQGEDTFAGKPIRVRFLWSDITPDSARWEQAFSGDGGATR